MTDGTERIQKVRQLIGLGPPNNGSALAELSHDPKRGEEIINKLTIVLSRAGLIPRLTGLYRMYDREVQLCNVFVWQA